LLAPVDQRLKSYEEQVGKLERERVDAFGQLNGMIQAVREGQEQVRAEAARLGNSLRNAPKARGRWGEQQLRNVLEQCGLSEHTDFVTEHSIETEEGRLRPDAIVRIPGNKLLVIDAKVSLNAYQDAFEAADDTARGVALAAHVQSMRNHIQTLGAKSYQSQFEEAPDYVLMFVPGEHFIAAALERDPQLWDFAFDRRVLLASPTNLVAICRTVAQVWRQDGLAREAREIGRMGGELYDRLAVAAEHLKRVGSGLEAPSPTTTSSSAALSATCCLPGAACATSISRSASAKWRKWPSSRPRPAMAPAMSSRNWPRPMALALQGKRLRGKRGQDGGIAEQRTQRRLAGLGPGACAGPFCLPARTGPAGERQPDCQRRGHARANAGAERSGTQPDADAGAAGQAHARSTDDAGRHRRCPARPRPAPA
jgi:hypothetical protein